MDTVTIDGHGKTTREINQELKTAIAGGTTSFEVLNPRHGLLRRGIPPLLPILPRQHGVGPHALGPCRQPRPGALAPDRPLPDPAQHTSDEWPAVVARMRKNIETMGRSPPSSAQSESIVRFLQRHAHTPPSR